MIQSIKDIITEYGIDGDILLYRDEYHRKKKLCEYIAENLLIEPEDIVCTSSDGAFGLYLARALPNNQVVTCFDYISPDYGEIMLDTPNLTCISEFRGGVKEHKKYAQQNGYVFVDQFNDRIVKDYYKQYFPHMVNAVSEYMINAFCDYGHSCATIAGFIECNKEEHLTGWHFLLGCNMEYRRNRLPHLAPYISEVRQVTFNDYDTYELGNKIEAMYPQFGNIYEGTRSISSAMRWLKQNPNNTVLIYIGDSFNKEGTKFR